jgi:hypothetical protein
VLLFVIAVTLLINGAVDVAFWPGAADDRPAAPVVLLLAGWLFAVLGWGVREGRAWARWSSVAALIAAEFGVAWLLRGLFVGEDLLAGDVGDAFRLYYSARLLVTALAIGWLMLLRAMRREARGRTRAPIVLGAGSLAVTAVLAWGVLAENGFLAFQVGVLFLASAAFGVIVHPAMLLSALLLLLLPATAGHVEPQSD